MVAVTHESIADIREKLGKLEADTATHKEQIAEIFRQNNVAARANAETAVMLRDLTETMKAQHTPDACPHKSKVDRIWIIGTVIGGIIVTLAFLGLGPMLGQWLMRQISGS